MRHFFQVDEKDAAQIENLSKRMQRLVYGAVDYNSLIQPGRTLTYKLYMGEKWQYPRLTDTSTLSGDITEQMGLVPFMVFKATSVSRNQTDFSPHYFAGDDQILDHNVRHILLTPDDATDRDVELNHPVNSKAVKLYNTLESSVPTAFDVFRDTKRTIREHVGKKPIPMTMARSADNVNKAEKVQHPWVEVTPGRAPKGSPRAVVVAMHWFQAGGAERWALETVKLVRDAGFIPIVITDRDGHQPWIADPAFDGAILLPMTMPVQERPGDSPVLRALFEQFDIAGILIHHCQWMYDNAWWVKTHFPQTRIVDSLHIVEYYFHGGFPKESVAHDKWIDLHHVISPQLERWLIDNHQIDASKVVDAPLVGLTADSVTPIFKERDADKPFTVVYIGRMVRQKRPEAFILTAKAMQSAYPGKFHFIMQGNGDMDAFADMMIKRYGLKDVIERRALDFPVRETYHDADALLVSSINEGITLTSIEAISAGVPVISANVGSQETLIPPKGLCRRMTSNFVHDAKSALSHILNNEEDRRKLWESELARLQKFSELESAEAYFKKMLKEWHD